MSHEHNLDLLSVPSQQVEANERGDILRRLADPAGDCRTAHSFPISCLAGCPVESIYQ